MSGVKEACSTSRILRSLPQPTSKMVLDDVAADGFRESRFEKVFFDLKVFNPFAPSNRRPQLSACYRSHEASKKQASGVEFICEIIVFNVY